MSITKEEVQEYISENFDTFFVEGLAKYVKDVICPDDDKKAMDEYRDELKQLIWGAIAHGVNTYLSEYNGEAVKIVAREFMQEFSKKDISIHFN